MNKQKRYKIKIKGITPLVWNRLTTELRELTKSLKKDELEENELRNWMMKAEVKDKFAIIPKKWISANLYNSAKQTRIVPWFATTKNQTYSRYVSNMVISMDKDIVAGLKKDLKRKDAMLSSQGSRTSGGKVLRCHPVLNEWSAEFVLIDTIGRMKIEELKFLEEWGGQAIGLGDQRSDNFGRFIVEEITELK